MKSLHELKNEHYDIWKQSYEYCCQGTDGVVTDAMIEREFRKRLKDKSES